MKRMIHGLLAAALAVLAGATPRASGPTATGTITINGKAYTVNGPAECHYTAAGSIYETPATMWSVMVSSNGGNAVSRLNATIWQPTGGGAAQIMFSAFAGSASYDIATARGGVVKGSATARAEQKGAGGTLAIDGRTAAGQAITMSVSCTGFTPPEDNG